MTPRTMSVADRLLSKVVRDPDTGCWEWTAYIERITGYGRLRVDRVSTQAHRLAYQLFVGDIPSGLEIDHLCGNRPCVNPAHLEAVTHRENILRGRSPTAANARKTHCPQGHAYTVENTYRDGVHRKCRACHIKRLRDRYHRRKAAA